MAWIGHPAESQNGNGGEAQPIHSHRSEGWARGQQFVDEIRREFWDATHNVYTFTVGDNDESSLQRRRRAQAPPAAGAWGDLEGGIKHCAVVSQVFQRNASGRRRAGGALAPP